ncbi:MAG: GIY-YIG nuclease family protein [Flavobacteriales bacterium]|nr:GIY-YIG nuclease family protein [Flavobacteriales bacterium]
MIKGYIYIITNYNRTVLYIGVTGNLRDRMLRHKVEEGSKFASKYKNKYLLYYEDFPDMKQAINREKQLKNWHREWKLNLIKELNPDLKDLADDWFDEETLENAKAGFTSKDQ